MPAAAVIPAPIAYVKIAAVKKLVVGLLVWCAEPALLGECLCAPTILLESAPVLHWIGWSCSRSFTLKKLECLKQAFAMNTLAWNNKIGLRLYFVGF